MSAGGRLQTWITVRGTGEVLRLFEGDAVKVGQLERWVVSIMPRSVVLESGEERFSVELGDSLRHENKQPMNPGEAEKT